MGIIRRILLLFSGFNWLAIPAALLAIIFHEFSHGYVASLLGDNTAKAKGRLSLNPAKHLDVLGLICMIFFGFGWAKPVPVNPYFFKDKKLGMILVSLAGPLSNIIMAFVSLFAGVALSRVSVENGTLPYLIMVLIEFFLYFSVFNVGLAVFNFLPIPPLDGSKILFSLLPPSAYGFILKYERYGMLILLILINLPFFSVFLNNVRMLVFSGIETVIYSILFG
ncbi:MAG: site-2 protease family protein [Oscillospiraceae bacterium]|nr:site-2 protease family protein [Oscillospiraceae bacterium]